MDTLKKSSCRVLLFIRKKLEQLKNAHVKLVSNKAITYTHEFKRHFIVENGI